MNLYYAKQRGMTKSGKTFKVLQDGPNSLHLTIQDGDVLAYDHLTDITSEEMLHERIALLEELFVIPLLPETTDEVDERPVLQ